MKINNFNQKVFDNPYAFIDDWHDLAAVTRGSTKYFAYALLNQDKLVKRVPQKKGRMTYKSTGSLEYVQNRLLTLLEDLQFGPDMDHVWAYKKGVNPRKEIQPLVGWKYLIKFDIKKYFDTISMRHVVETLEHFGFSHAGAKLVARYATVRTKKGKTLQQGSKTSGAISNLVGYVHFDRQIKDALADLKAKNPHMVYHFVRYCDNVYLWLDGEFDISVLKEYQTRCNEIVRKARFKTHQWERIPLNHPKRNQKVLGMVLNAQARIELEEFYRIRAILFNCCLHGIDNESKKYYEMYYTDAFDGCATEEIAEQAKLIKFKQYLRGKVAYIKSVSEKQGTQLHKLLLSATMLEGDRWDGIPDFVLDEVKKYKDSTLTADAYINGVSTARALYIARSGYAAYAVQATTAA